MIIKTENIVIKELPDYFVSDAEQYARFKITTYRFLFIPIYKKEDIFSII